MDVLIISKENYILHVCNQGYTVDYTIYDNKGHSLDGGVFESTKDKFETDKVIKEIIEMIKESYQFSESYMYLYGERAEGLLDLIQMEDYKNSQLKLKNYLSSLKNNEKNDLEIIK